MKRQNTKAIQHPYLVTWNGQAHQMGFWNRDAAERFARSTGYVCSLWIRTVDDEFEFVGNVG